MPHDEWLGFTHFSAVFASPSTPCIQRNFLSSSGSFLSQIFSPNALRSCKSLKIPILCYQTKGGRGAHRLRYSCSRIKIYLGLNRPHPLYPGVSSLKGMCNGRVWNMTHNQGLYFLVFATKCQEAPLKYFFLEFIMLQKSQVRECHVPPTQRLDLQVTGSIPPFRHLPKYVEKHSPNIFRKFDIHSEKLWTTLNIWYYEHKMLALSNSFSIQLHFSSMCLWHRICPVKLLPSALGKYVPQGHPSLFLWAHDMSQLRCGKCKNFFMTLCPSSHCNYWLCAIYFCCKLLLVLDEGI